MIRIAVCDDNISELETIHEMVIGFTKENPDSDFSVRCFHSASELLVAIDAGSSFQIYLLDIVMPNINGIDIGESIREKDDIAIIIYLTSSQEYALQAYSVFAYQYLLKPVPIAVLYEVLKKALLKIGLEKEQILSVKTKEGLAAIRFHQILFVEYRNHSLVFNLVGGSTVTTVSSREPFEWTANKLLEDNRFARPHVSFVLNMRHARAITGKNFLMANESPVPISQKNYTEIKRQYIDFLLHEGENKC